MTRQTWTAVVAALVFLACVAVVSFVPVPFVVWTPGATYNLLGTSNGRQVVDVAEAHQTTGELRLTTVGATPADAHVNLVEALMAYWEGARDALPRDAVYSQQLDPLSVTSNEIIQMDTSQQASVVAAVREAGLPVRELPMVETVSASGPAAEYLKVGDLITKIDETTTTSLQDVQAAILRHHVGDSVVVSFLRDGAESHENITTKASATEPNVPTIGITLAMGYTYSAKVAFNVDPAIGGPSGGLMFSLAVYDKLTRVDVAAGRVVAGTGTINAQGEVGSIGGIQEKIAAATRDHATMFLMPAANCADVAQPVTIQLVPVSTLDEAVKALQVADATTLKGCP